MIPVSVRLRDKDGNLHARGRDEKQQAELRKIWSEFFAPSYALSGSAFDRAPPTERVGDTDAAKGDAFAKVMNASASLTSERAKDLATRLRSAGDLFKVTLDPVIASTDVWTRFAPGGAMFGQRRHALELIGAGRQPKGSDVGKDVNVVIFDYGISNDWLAAYRGTHQDLYTGVEGGWSRYQRRPGGDPDWYYFGKGPPLPELDHGHMIARNILSIAPAVTIWDVPLLPDTLLGPPRIAMAEAMFYYVRRDIRGGALHQIPQTRRKLSAHLANLPTHEPWIFVNAWGVLDPLRISDGDSERRGGTDEILEYWNDARHFFVEDMETLSNQGIDVVFAAGNCGSPSPAPRCAETATGPGLSIHGVNAHKNVLTVGAVRVDGVPVGLSAQGPGALAQWKQDKTDKSDSFYQKPDICAPSHFREDDDGYTTNTGTSAACGIAAGMLAALRSAEREALKVDTQGKKRRRKPDEMRQLLRDCASHPDVAGVWHERLGWGIPNLKRGIDMAKLLLDKEASPPPPAP